MFSELHRYFELAAISVCIACLFLVEVWVTLTMERALRAMRRIEGGAGLHALFRLTAGLLALFGCLTVSGVAFRHVLAQFG